MFFLEMSLASRILLLCLAVVFAAATPAQASEPTFRATVSPERVVFGETTRLTYRVEVVTGEEPERFTILASPPAQFGGQGPLLFPEGTGVAIEGPGTFGSGSSSHGDPGPCHDSELRTGHGGLFFAQ